MSDSRQVNIRFHQMNVNLQNLNQTKCPCCQSLYVIDRFIPFSIRKYHQMCERDKEIIQTIMGYQMLNMLNLPNEILFCIFELLNPDRIHYELRCECITSQIATIRKLMNHMMTVKDVKYFIRPRNCEVSDMFEKKLQTDDFGKHRIVGLDLEYTYDQEKIAVVQLCFGTDVLVFHYCRFGFITNS